MDRTKWTNFVKYVMDTNGPMKHEKERKRKAACKLCKGVLCSLIIL